MYLFFTFLESFLESYLKPSNELVLHFVVVITIAETNSDSCKTSKMEILAKVVKPLTLS